MKRCDYPRVQPFRNGGDSRVEGGGLTTHSIPLKTKTSTNVSQPAIPTISQTDNKTHKQLRFTFFLRLWRW
jgi:hypothetical protein